MSEEPINNDNATIEDTIVSSAALGSGSIESGPNKARQEYYNQRDDYDQRRGNRATALDIASRIFQGHGPSIMHDFTECAKSIEAYIGEITPPARPVE